MLLLLLLLFKAATARTPFHELQIESRVTPNARSVTPRYGGGLLDSEDGYIEAYSGDQENQFQDGSDYMDYKTDDSYEYEQDLDDSSSGEVDFEVNKNI